jgi:hypothetical protein
MASGLLDRGLVAHYKLDGNARDSTPYSNHGTITGATGTTDRKGKANGALVFDGVDDSVLSGITPATINAIIDNLTISLWAKLRVAGLVEKIAVGTQDPTNARLYIGLHSSGGWSFGLGNLAWRVTEATATADWQHVVLTVDKANNIANLFMNNVVVQTRTNWTWFGPTTVSPWIGRLSVAGFSWDGSIADVRFYNRTLTAAEVKALYESYRPRRHWLTLKGQMNMISSLIEGVAVATAVANSKEIIFTDQAGGFYTVPTGSSITSMTWHTAAKPGGTYVAAYDEAGIAVVQTVEGGRSYELPGALAGAGALKAVGDAAGTIDLNLKA